MNSNNDIRPPAPALVPVPVSERLPGEGDCDAVGRCWWLARWRCGPHKIRLDSERMEGDTHWLPAHAIPLPRLWHEDVRAAIREVAAAARGRIAPFDPSLKWGDFAQWLEQEADR